MSKKVISYKLNFDGTIPDFIEDGGYLPSNPNDISEMVLLGISKEDADLSQAIQVFETEADCLAYTSTYLTDHTLDEPVNLPREFILADAVSSLFAKLA